MELRTTRIFERFSTTVSKNKQRYAESDPTQADLHALGTNRNFAALAMMT